MNVLIDHGGHSDLYHSMYALFEKRLGWNLYFPIGDGWVEKGFVTAHYAIQSPDELEREENKDGIHYHYVKMEPDKGRYVMKGIEFDKFLEMDFGIILTTTYYQESPFYNLVKTHKPEAKFVRQIANIHEKSLGYCKNILLGAAFHPSDYGNKQPDQAFRSAGMNHIIYYPEQYEGYSYTEPVNHKKVICLSRHIAPPDLAAWNAAKERLIPHGFEFQMYGLQYEKYDVDPIYGESIPHHLLPEGIKNAGFVWYTKPAGGGGFTVRQAMACGRPVIVRKSYSSSHTIIESELFKPGINCIDLDQSGANGTISLLQAWSEPTKHIKICKATASEFEKDTNFAETAEKIRAWLNRLPKGVV